MTQLDEHWLCCRSLVISLTFRKEDSDKLIGVIKKVCYPPIHTLLLLYAIIWRSCASVCAALHSLATSPHATMSQLCLLLLVSLLDTAMGSLPTELHVFRLLHS